MNSLESCAPKFDGLILRSTGKQIIGVKGYLHNLIAMASDGSQHITITRVPKSDDVVRRLTGKDIVGSKCH